MMKIERSYVVLLKTQLAGITPRGVIGFHACLVLLDIGYSAFLTLWSAADLQLSLTHAALAFAHPSVPRLLTPVIIIHRLHLAALSTNLRYFVHQCVSLQVVPIEAPPVIGHAKL